MSTNAFVTKELAIDAFYKLNARFQELGIQCRICLSDGRAFIFINDLRTLSKDFDYVSYTITDECHDFHNTIRLAIMEVGEELGLDITWMNDAVKIFASSNEAYGESFCFGEALSILIPTPECLLAMKCSCFRGESDNHDREDIENLAKICHITTLDEIVTNFKVFYPDKELSLECITRLEEICDNLSSQSITCSCCS